MNRVANPVSVKMKVPFMIACLCVISDPRKDIVIIYSKECLDRTSTWWYSTNENPSKILGIKRR